MRFLDGEFLINDSGYHDGDTYKMKGQFRDSTATSYASMVQPGDIIYADGSFLSLPLMRYKIVSIVKSETLGSTLSVIVKWDLEGVEAQEPFGAMDAIIGAMHPNGLTANIPAPTENNKVTVARAHSYQTYLLSKSANSTEELDAIKKDIADINDKLCNSRLEWE